MNAHDVVILFASRTADKSHCDPLAAVGGLKILPGRPHRGREVNIGKAFINTPHWWLSIKLTCYKTKTTKKWIKHFLADHPEGNI